MRWVHDLHPSGGQGSEVSPAYIPVLVATPGPRRHPLQLQAATTYPFDEVAGVPPLLCFWPSAARRTESTHAAMSHAPMPTVLLSRNDVHATGGISEVLYLSTSAASDAHSCSMCCDNRVCKLSASESDGVLITHSFTLLVTAASMVAFAHFLLR